MRASSFPRLITFQAVAESGAIVRAAAALGVAPSTVSETITALERDLGVRLFNRTTRNVGLTEAGEVFLGRVRGILTELEGAVAELDPYRGEAMGALRLGVSSLALSVVVAPMLHAFMAAHPRVRLEISIDDDVVGSLMQARVDAGIRGLAGIPQDMIAQRVSPPSRLVAVASPDYLARCGVPSRVCDLAAHNCIGLRLTTGAIWPWTFELEGRSVSFTPQGTLVTDSIDFVLTAACGGIGIAYTTRGVNTCPARSGPSSPSFAPARRTKPLRLRDCSLVPKRPYRSAVLIEGRSRLACPAPRKRLLAQPRWVSAEPPASARAPASRAAAASQQLGTS